MAGPDPYPYASAPDIVRAHQKDAYFAGHLANALADLHRRLAGARAAHAAAPEVRALAAPLLYLGLTTLPGNRTLGEEYCDLVQVHAPGGSLPALRARAAYVVGAVLVPYLAARGLPRLRGWVRAVIDRRLERLRRDAKAPSPSSSSLSSTAREARILDYMARHLPSLMSDAPLNALVLALFYFNGTYYELTKRLLSLRYVFTRTVPDTPDRAGYEVLGVLLVVQLAVQAFLHLHSTLLLAPSASTSSAPAASSSSTSSAAAVGSPPRQRGPFQRATVDVSLDHVNSYAANSDLLLSDLGASPGPQASRVDLATATHTPVAAGPRFDLADEKVMPYIRGQQQRKCTLCLEELKDPAATQCGHVFCWGCIGDWVREKPECPLCRREAMVQHILPLRVM
ncbi:pex2/pex12 domain-containing protein [Hirsutella rhossiliensis]|uniref:RING-type E3 ubiquitin transferase n=1 Tax=Hirsutella rhossiliensis TaxID=111463 RepID=A0A9P8SHX4_9HYPO|nr:pex2/pex12 domain-containing protein [Hirsutella rhossiliensis]KAH0963256.1 pex2/pex12 domain-containing protein [Hirsutella rhossiliensis]